jgi:NAD(P)H dehydrogenase (quinone)
LHADTSVLGLAAEHKVTEAAIRTSGVPYVFLRNGWYTENYAAGIPTALSLGAVYGCAGDGRIASATRADYAEAAAVALTADNQAGKTYELAGDNAFTLSEFAAEISRQSGKAIGYVNLPEAEYKKALLGAGLPEFLAELLANSDTGVSKGALFDDGHQLSKLIGRPTTPLATAVKAAL